MIAGGTGAAFAHGLIHFHHKPFAQGHAPVHAAGKLEIVRGDERGQARGADDLV